MHLQKLLYHLLYSVLFLSLEAAGKGYPVVFKGLKLVEPTLVHYKVDSCEYIERASQTRDVK